MTIQNRPLNAGHRARRCGPPGRMVQEEGGRRGVWSLDMGQDQLLAIEQVEGRAGGNQLFQGAVTFALCGLAAAVTGVLFALFRRAGVAS